MFVALQWLCYVNSLFIFSILGDAEYKPYVTATPDVREIPLDGGEDFLIIACDGLWDVVSEDMAARTVYQLIGEDPGKCWNVVTKCLNDLWTIIIILIL